MRRVVVSICVLLLLCDRHSIAHAFSAAAPPPDLPSSSTPPPNNNNIQQRQQEQLYADLQRAIVTPPPAFPDVYAQRSARPVVLSSDVDGALRCVHMLRLWRKRKKRCPSIAAYQLVFDTLLRRGRVRWKIPRPQQQQAQQVFDSSTTNTHGIVDTMELLWDWLCEDYANHDDDATDTTTTAVAPSVASCRLALLRAYAISSSQKKQYAAAAHAVLRQQQQHAPQSAFHVLHAYCWQQGKQGKSAAEAAEQLYLEYKDTWNSPPPSSAAVQFEPNATELLIEAYSKAEGGAQKCQEYYDLLEDPGTESKINLVVAWARVDALTAADRLRTCFPQQDAPAMAVTTIVSVLGRIGEFAAARSVLYEQKHVEILTYNSLLANWLKRKNVSAQQRMNEMQQLAQHMQQHSSCHPNAFTYYTLLKAQQQSKMASSEECTEYVATILQRRAAATGYDTPADTSTAAVDDPVIHNLLLSVYATNRQGERALQFLRHNMTHVADTISYTTVLQALAVSSSQSSQSHDDSIATTVQTLLDACPAPTVRTYTMAIQCLAQHKGDPALARHWLEQAQAGRNSFPYNYVLQCCGGVCTSSTDKKEQAFAIAAQTFKDLQGFRDSFSYVYWIQCCRRLLPSRRRDQQSSNNNAEDGCLRDKCVRLAMDQAKEEGVLHPVLLRRLVQSFPPRLVAEILELNDTTKDLNVADKTIADFPAAWSRNVEQGQKKQYKTSRKRKQWR